ncbi:MAG: hypothetical protein V5A40_04600 [Haloarculaceae archaeon]
MSDDTIATYLAEHPKMAGVLFTTMLLQSRTRSATTRSMAYAGP